MYLLQKKLNSVRKFALLSFALAGAALLGACGGSSSAEQAGTVQGVASKGPIDAAVVTVFALNADGSHGSYLGMTTTTANGGFSLQVDYEGAMAIVVTEGTYVDEATGLSVHLSSDDVLEVLVSSASKARNVAVTALTTIAAERARASASFGLETAIVSAHVEVAALFELDGIDIASTIPSDLTRSASARDSREAKRYGLVQAGLTQLAKDNGESPEAVLRLVADIALDFSSGMLDGQTAAGTAIESALSITPSEAVIGLEMAQHAFLQGPRNASDLTDIPVF